MRRAGGRVSCVVAPIVALALALPNVACAAPRRDAQLEAQLLEHIRVLASDEFQGRQPGTEGEAKTLRYLGRQWFDLGLESGTNDPGHEWFAPFTIVAREPAASSAQFSRKGKRLMLPANSVLMTTSSQRSLVKAAPLLFVGKGQKVPPRSELAGRVAVLLDEGIETRLRQNALLDSGAAAVLTILDDGRTLETVAERRRRSGYALSNEDIGGDLDGYITSSAMNGLLRGGEKNLADLRRDASVSGFAPYPLGLDANLEATTRETRILTHNLIGKLPGRRPSAGAVVFVAHWDHFGVCAEPPAQDRICHGAIDNASGVAALTEIARRLSRGPRLDRDVLFLATSAEELGLLGAEAFAENPPLPLGQIVAVFNIDSVAIAPAGTPLAIVGKGMTTLDPQIFAVARQQKRKIVNSDDANAYVRRQDGWAFLQHDVPAVMVSSAYGNMGLMEEFFDTSYHRPADTVTPKMELGGAAQDVQFLVALGRWFGDPMHVPSRMKRTP